MFYTKKIPKLIIAVCVHLAGCGTQNTSTLDTFWALNQKDDIVVAKRFNQDLITIFKCPTSKNSSLLGDTVDLGDLESCSDKVMIYDSLSYQAFKDTLLGMSHFLIQEMTDATQAELFSQYFNEREGVYERVWHENRRNELKQSADAMNALIVRKKAIGKKVAPGDEIKLDKTRSELLEAEKTLEAIDSMEMQIELLVHEFWDLIQEQSVFQTRLTSLQEGIVFLGLDESKAPKHNLFNLWFRDLSSSLEDINLTKILENKRRYKEDGTEVTITSSSFIYSSGETIVLIDSIQDKSSEPYKTELLLTTVTFNETDGEIEIKSEEFGSMCPSYSTDFQIYTDLVIFKCSNHDEGFVLLQKTADSPLKLTKYKLQSPFEKKVNIAFFEATRIENDWIFMLMSYESKELFISSLERIKNGQPHIWRGTIAAPDDTYGRRVKGIQKITQPNEGVVFSLGAEFTYFLPWPIPVELDVKSLFRKLTYSRNPKYNLDNFIESYRRSRSGRNYRVFKDRKNESELLKVEYVVGIKENPTAPENFEVETTEFTMLPTDFAARNHRNFYWRGHINDTILGGNWIKVSKPYFF